MNNLKKSIVLLISIAIFGQLAAQDNLLNVNNHADCDSLLQIQTTKNVGPTTSPLGHGTDLEFSQNSKESLHFMEQENHSVWYKFEAKTNGNLIFEIEPLDSLNDYDFALYQFTGEGFCEAVKNKSILPVRTNFSRNKPEFGSKTGLSLLSKEAFVTAGINPSYSQSIAVKPKEEYVLVVNNVYDNGLGHILHFDYGVNLSLNGVVVDMENQSSLEADVTLTNTKTGDVVASTKSDSVGVYKLVFELPKSQLNDPLHLEVSKDGYFFQDTLLTAFKIAKDMTGKKLETKIRKLKQGERFIVQNILFHGNSPKPMDTSFPTIHALYKTMLKNKSLKIRIEGHTNGCSHGTDYSINLSNARAETVVNYLLEHQVDQNRISFIGHGCQFMLHAENGSGAHLNRRVEIEVVEL